MTSELDLTRFYDVIIRNSVFQLGFLTWEIQIPVIIVEITHKMRTSFKTLASRKAATWHLKKSLSNIHFSQKVISSSYHIE